MSLQSSQVGEHDRQIGARRGFVGDDHDATVRLANDVVARGYRGMDEQIIAGGVEHVAERMAGFGVDDIVARTIAVDQPNALRSIELLGAVRELIAG